MPSSLLMVTPAGRGVGVGSRSNLSTPIQTSDIKALTYGKESTSRVDALKNMDVDMMPVEVEEVKKTVKKEKEKKVSRTVSSASKIKKK